MLYSATMQKCFFTKRCFHTTKKIQDENQFVDEKCRKNCNCVKYHYFNVQELIPSIIQDDIQKLISEGIFCNAQCGKHKLSNVIMSVMTSELLTKLLSVFKDPSTQIGNQTNTVDRAESSSSVSTRARTGSADADERRQLIADIDDDTSEQKEEDDIDDQDEEDVDNDARERDE